jgi:hypothetical protein
MENNVIFFRGEIIIGGILSGSAQRLRGLLCFNFSVSGTIGFPEL